MSTRKKNPYRLATKRLAGIDPDWARLIEAVGPCTLEVRESEGPYEALVRAVAFQQLHARAAEAILGRMLALFPRTAFPSPKQLLGTDVEVMRACGFSARKVESIRSIAEGAKSGLIPTREEAEGLDDEALIERLTPLRGVGRWTVEMLLIFTLGRTDVLPADDFGVRDGYRRLKSLEEMPRRAELAALGAGWSPHRTVASWYLWRVPR